jgi:hypothetical protein
MIAIILGAILPVLATALLGYLWTRAGRPLDSATITLLVTDIGTPCLIISTFANSTVPPAAFGETAAAAATMIVGFITVSALLLRLLRLRLRTYLPAVAFPNSGNLGIPLSLYAFGPEGLGYAIVFFTVTSLANFTVGQAIAAGAVSWRAILRLPILYGVIVGVLIATVHLALPRWLANMVALLGSFAVPLMLLQLGASLGRLKVATLPRALLLAALRIVMGGAVGFAVTFLFGLNGTARSVLILLSAMPAAVFNYLFALRWQNEPEEIAGIVVVSTLAAIITAPALLYLLMD